MPKAKAPVSARTTAPWWLSDGDEECTSCGHLYIYELEFRCSECDVASCVHCRRRLSDGRFVCTSCADSGAKVSRHGR